MSQDEGSCPKNEKTDMQFGSFIGMWGRSRPVGAFPSDQSLMRLAGCIMININEEWVTGKKDLTMDVE